MHHEPHPPPNNNIVLTGFMGTGKTTIGRLLADRVGYEFVDTDSVIEDRHGPITDIFAAHGEARFRSIERALVAELAERSRLVISTGGGTLLDDASADALGRSGTVFCLVATPDEILTRVRADPSRVERPLLTVADPAGRIAQLLAERATAYARFAQVTTTGRTPDEIAAELAERAAPA